MTWRFTSGSNDSDRRVETRRSVNEKKGTDLFSVAGGARFISIIYIPLDVIS